MATEQETGRGAVISSTAPTRVTASDSASLISLGQLMQLQNTQLASALLLPLFAYKVGALINGVKLQWYLDATIAFAAVGLPAECPGRATFRATLSLSGHARGTLSGTVVVTTSNSS